MTRGDRIVIAVVIAVAALSWPAMLLASGGVASARTVTVTGPFARYTVPLQAERTLKVRGLVSDVVVVVDRGAVHVAESGCRDRLCIEQGAVRSGAIVCLPNGVTVKVAGAGDELDAYIR